jgi:serine/threonine protein kinase
MNTDDQDRSLGDAATFAGSSKRRSAHASLGDERTLGGGDAAGIDTVFDDIEVVDLAARYKTEGTLGRGGMGEVLLALDTRLDRKVAIKRILGEAARSKTAVSRFLTEAKAIAALNHPNVVQIYDYGRAADGPFLIMEYVDGSSLLDRCRDGALPLEQAVDLACQLCDGLAKAHDLGIVHRDIKPANVLLTKDGLPKLTDFGLAKAEATDHQMTMTGAVLGTPDFMPPEQRKDAALVDPRSDLWSLAASLYQMVTGRSPKIIRFDLLPPGLTSVLGKALEESKDDRYQSAREFRDALKTSLVASAPAAAELGEGQCPACGVKNDSSRRFCRGCGEALEAPCLSCSKPMPMWEHICGQCGTKQAPLLEDRRGEMAARQAEAEGLLKDYDFDHAERIAATLRDESDPRLNHLRPWAITFLPQVEKARREQVERANTLVREALRHEQAFDYQSGLHSLSQIPEILRTSVVGDDGDSPAQVLDRLSGKQSQCSKRRSKPQSRVASSAAC